ncbi:dihydrodipicolinate synthase family protein [Streptomyces sp. H39-S7]|uniref:dihydrodipicolinate synthase family protein n=1 Tax=Streptomyces sp. H39-S7 TaxID=3004357 RepID=UPI0022AFF119|nr:dihydrodipicolinate synthase family protein [Streptomyces sp. H39-S7]MCZ4125362.1 dihydrodipicolinate synthase family protein [Streptomyces sp. H39-S7]
MAPAPSPWTDLRIRLATVIAIPVTPFAADGSVDWETYAALVRRLVEHGLQVITPKGNTGEFYTLSETEARRAVESAVGAAGDRAEVMAGVGLDTQGAIAAARHAREAGAGSLMIHQPVHPYRSAERWIDYHRNIAESVPELGVVLYVRDERVSGAQIRMLAEHCPNVIGVKYAVPDPVRFACVARDAGLERFAWIAGLAELHTPGFWATGAVGFTSGLVNVAPRLSLALFEALRGGDYPKAMRVWESARAFEELRAADASADNVSVVKEALAQLGLSRRAVRPPSRLLPTSVRDGIGELITQWRKENWL